MKIVSRLRLLPGIVSQLLVVSGLVISWTSSGYSVFNRTGYQGLRFRPFK